MVRILHLLHIYIYIYMDVSENSGTVPPKSSILIGFSIINHPFLGTPIFGNTYIYIYTYNNVMYLGDQNQTSRGWSSLDDP